MKAGAAGALHDVSVAAGGLLDQASLAELVVDKARSIAGGDAAVLRWFDQASGSFRLLASTGTSAAPTAEIASETSTAISAAFKAGRPVIVNNYEATGRATSWGRSQKIRAQVAVPLLVEGRPLGTLAVLSFARHRYEEGDALFLSLMAAMVGPALQAARLSEEVRRQTEMVTQVYDALGVFVIVYDRFGRPIHYNSAARAEWGGALEDPSGARDHSYPTFHRDGRSMGTSERPFARALAAKAPIRGLVVGFDVAGERRWAYVDAVPVLTPVGEVDFVITSSIDVTQLKNAEARQRADADRLRHLVALQVELGKPDATVDRILQLVVDTTVQLTGAPGAAVQLLDGEEVVIASCAGFGSVLKDRRLPLKGSPINGCIAEGGAESTSDALVDPRCNQEIARSTAFARS